MKDEKNFDKFDRAFAAYFKDVETCTRSSKALIPDEWLRREFEKLLSEEEKAEDPVARAASRS